MEKVKRNDEMKSRKRKDSKKLKICLNESRSKFMGNDK
jgi:hypothetical protein